MKLVSSQFLLVNSRRICAVFFLLCLLGCATRPWSGFPAGYDEKLAWPPPPEPARVGFVMQIRSHADLFQETGFWHSVGELLGGKADSKMQRPFALALHPGGGLLVTDTGRHCVHFYNWGRQRYVEIGAKRNGGLPLPVGVAALRDGRILVADSRLGSVEVFDIDGKSLGPFCAKGTLARPAGIAVDDARGVVYITDVTGQCIKVFDMKGALVRSFGKRGDGPGQFNYPTHLALDPQGRLAVTDSMNARVQIFGPDGAPVARFGKLGDAPGSFSKPKGIAADGEGHIMTVEGLFDAIQFFDTQGQFLLSLGGSGHAPGEFWLPAGLCYDPAERLLFVADTYNKRVQVFRMLGAK